MLKSSIIVLSRTNPNGERMRKKVTLQTEVQVLYGRYGKSYSALNAAPITDNAERVTIAELMSPTFANNRHIENDLYTFPATHEYKSFRAQKDSPMVTEVDEFTTAMFAFDLDWYGDDGDRSVWKTLSQSKGAVESLLSSSSLVRDSHLISASKGGIRLMYVLDYELTAPEWQVYYDNMEKELVEQLGSSDLETRSNQTAIVSGEFTFVMDRRYPYGLTRVPFGYRDSEETIDASYMYYRTLSGTLSIDRYGEPTSDIHKVSKLTSMGYKRQSIANKRMPLPTKQPKLPAGVFQFSWGDDGPPQSMKDEAIYHAVMNAITRYKDMMTPEQYFTYFKYAMHQVTVGSGGEDPLILCWKKICANYHVRMDSLLPHDRLQILNSGNMPLFPPSDFEDALDVNDVYDYTEKAKDIYREILIESTTGSTTFFNPPAGAGKSTAATSVLEARGGIYIAPTGKNLLDFAKKFKGPPLNHVLSYRELIKVLFVDDKCLIAVLIELHDNVFNELRRNAAREVWKYNNGRPDAVKVPLVEVWGTKWGVKSFVAFLAEHAEGAYKPQSKVIGKEHAKRVDLMGNGETSILTVAKIMTLCARDEIRGLNPDHMVIFDEAKPQHVIDPEVYIDAEPEVVYGTLQAKPFIEDYDVQCEFHDFMQKHTVLFINADRGLDVALRHNKFPDVEVVGRDMKCIYDKDLHIVLSPDMKAGFTPHRNVKDKSEYSPRAIYAQLVDSSIYTLLTNGKGVDGKKLTANNLTVMVGSNDYLNSHVISMLTSPAPAEIAKYMYATGIDEHQARKILFQNQINQVVARNVGYRAQAVCARHDESYNRGKSPHNNMHILLLPSTAAFDELDLCVKTSNIWTSHSPAERIPVFLERYLKRLPETEKLIAELYQIPQGAYRGMYDISKRIKVPQKRAQEIFDKLVDDPMFCDFRFIKVKTIDGVKTHSQIYRSPSLKEALSTIIDSLDGESITRKEFGIRLREITNGSYIKQMTAKEAKDFIETNAFRYNYRLVGSSLVPCDEANLFN